MSMTHYTYAGFGLVIPREKIIKDLWDENDGLSIINGPQIIFGESDSVFVTHFGKYVVVDPYADGFAIELEGLSGSTRAEADAIRALAYRLTGEEPAGLKTYLYGTTL